MFIGHYSAANALTLFGLLSAVTSCFLAAKGNFKFAVYMLFLSFLCDTFDGKLARSTPNRTPAQKFYGVQLDSLCDTVSFGVAPCFLAFFFGFDGVFDVIIYGLFVLCGTIRLAYFNTLSNENPGRMQKSFRGIPIPTSVPLVILLFVLTTFIPAGATLWIFRIAYLALAIGFILNIKIAKPNIKKGAIILALQIVLLLVLVIAGDCKVPV